MPLISLYVTDHTPAFTMLARQFLGMPVDEPVRVNVEHLALSSDIR